MVNRAVTLRTGPRMAVRFALVGGAKFPGRCITGGVFALMGGLALDVALFTTWIADGSSPSRALALAGIIMVSATAILWQLVVKTADTTNQAVANLQVHYVSSWNSEDVVQAGNISLEGNSTTGNFPLVIYWMEPEETTITYYVEPMEDKLGNDLWRLNRTRSNAGGTGTAMVAEHLTPQSTGVCKLPDIDVGGNITQVNVLRLQVGAFVDDREATAIYEIHPRANEGNITWVVGEDQFCVGGGL